MEQICGSLCSKVACILELFFFNCVKKLVKFFFTTGFLIKNTQKQKHICSSLKITNFHKFQWSTFCYFLYVKLYFMAIFDIYHLLLESLKHNNTFSLLIRLHSGHIFLFYFLNTYEICYRRGFVTKRTRQRLDVVSRIFKHQTSNRHDLSSVWSFHRYDNVRTGSHRKHEFYGQVSFTSEMYAKISIVLGACLERTRRRAISFNQ